MENLVSFFSDFNLVKYGEAVIILIGGLIVSKLISRLILPYLLKAISDKHQEFLRKIIFYSMNIIVFMATLGHMGLNLKVLLGAAGVFTVAIGFASQTSVSNLISGLFLMTERPFVVGDTIQTESITGVVISIDLFSTRLRTFDNLLIRVPNESLMKSQIVNLTHFAIRRIDLKFGIAYKEDIKSVEKLLKEIVDEHFLCLDEPAPIFMVSGFGESSINLQFSVWVKRENFLKVKTDLFHKIKMSFDKNGVEIPFPQRVVIHKNETGPQNAPPDVI